MNLFFSSLSTNPRSTRGRVPVMNAAGGKARGTNLNVPMPAGSGDSEYTTVFTDLLIPALQDFAPEFTLISAGI